MNIYPYLNEWLAATRRSESGLVAVLIVSVAAVGLLWMYNKHIADDMPNVRRLMMALFVILSVGLAVMG